MKTKVYTITIPGEPVAKARPRMTRTGHVYTPKKTVEQEALIKQYWIIEYGQNPVDWAVHMEVDIYFSIPKRVPKKRLHEYRSNEVRPMKTPDVDNCLKAVADALNGVAYMDDKQVVSATVRKFWSDEPRTEIRIRKA